MNTENDEILTLSQAGEHARVCRQAVYLAIRKGLIKAEKVKNRWYLKKSDLDHYRMNKFNGDNRRNGGEYIFDIEKGKFSVNQVHKMLCVELHKAYDKQRIYYLLRSGRLKGSRKGAAWIIDKEDFVALLEKESGTNYNQLRFA